MTKFKKRLLLAVMAIVAGLMAGRFLAPIEPRFYINTTPSLPVGIYKAVPVDGGLKIGEIVIFDAPESVRSYVYGRGWIPEGTPLMKRVAALSDDEYCITDMEIFINRRYVGPVFAADSQERRLPRLRGTWRVEKDRFLPIATDISNSFDGRYFGTVPISSIRCKAVPLIVF